jgi:translation elongation factor EF-4
MKNINDIPSSELEAMRRKVIEQIQYMDSDELKIATKSKESLTHVIANLFKSIAYSIGYIIALPLAFAAKIIESTFDGFARGWDAAWD